MGFNSAFKGLRAGISYRQWLSNQFSNHHSFMKPPESYKEIVQEGAQTISMIKPTRCTIFRVYWISLYMFRTVFPSITRSSRLYIQHQVYVTQVRWLHASGHEMELRHRPHFGPSSTNIRFVHDTSTLCRQYMKLWRVVLRQIRVQKHY